MTPAPPPRRKGSLGTLAFVLSYTDDLLFDLRYGTETVFWARLKKLKIRSRNRSRGVDYQPTQVYPLRRLLSTLALPKGKIFIDLGCGKGRTLMIAAPFGFGEVRGVDFSPELCAVARKNWERYRSKSGTTVPCRIVESDVVDYPIRDEEVFFAFNPFDDHVLNCVLQKIADSLHEHDRPIWFIYRNPLHRTVVEKSGFLSPLGSSVYAGSDFAVYFHGGAESVATGEANRDVGKSGSPTTRVKARAGA